jgi:hypothetical protein
MAKSILLIASRKDYETLLEYCRQLGLQLLPMKIDIPVKEPQDGPTCYLGHMEISGLHPYGVPPVRITDVKDPLLLFVRPYQSPPYLIDGGIHLNLDNQQVSNLIRPTFEKLRRWVKKNWHKTESHASYVGTEALLLLNSGEAQWRSHTQGMSVQYVVTGQR